MERNTQRLGSHAACVEPQGKMSSQKNRRLTQTGRRPPETQRTKDRYKVSAGMERQAAPQTLARTNQETSQEPNGTNGTEHSTVGITRAFVEPKGKMSSEKNRRLTQTGRRPRETQRTKDHYKVSVAMERQAAPHTLSRTNQETSQEPNGTYGTEHSTFGITRGVCRTKGKRSSQKTRRTRRLEDGRL